MHAYRMQEVDGRLQLQLQDVPRPEPGAGQLLLRVRAAGLNRGEFIVGHGLHGRGSGAKPVGNEAAGEVVALGAGVEGWRIGERAMGRCPGAFAEFALLDAARGDRGADGARLARGGRRSRSPSWWSTTCSCCRARLRAGETLLVAGVTSGVGVSALKAAKAMGAKVIGTSGSAAKLERLARRRPGPRRVHARRPTSPMPCCRPPTGAAPIW